jgi:hypothetical protein
MQSIRKPKGKDQSTNFGIASAILDAIAPGSGRIFGAAAGAGSKKPEISEVEAPAQADPKPAEFAPDNPITRMYESRQEEVAYQDPKKQAELANQGFQQFAALPPDVRSHYAPVAVKIYQKMTGQLPPSPDEVEVG